MKPEGHYGFLEYGKGRDIFLIVTHLDIVSLPEDQKFNNIEIIPKIEKNKIYARGINDDKGPAFMAIYALKYLIDQNWKPNNFIVKIVFGLDEENEMRCLKKYIQDFGAPTLGFTPDGFFHVFMLKNQFVI
ncbi:M20/M25/M40 family metallo-hydrolase [Spiroplasma taiwanense]|nr:M20/M25/M40 family metallo-hydrolase [Spiroplasma taiwanense]